MVGTMQVQCPNCGHILETLRHDLQPAGERSVHLHWLVCPGCTHVALYTWGFVDDMDGDDRLVRENWPCTSEITMNGDHSE